MTNHALCGLVLWATILNSASAGETLEQLLNGLKITQVSEFRYSETREMKLLSRPSLAQGNMYISPQQMVIEQVTPKPSLILVGTKRMQYLEPSRGIQFVKKLDRPFAAPGIGNFLGLMQGQMTRGQLQAQYSIELEQHQQGWKIVLSPRKKLDIGRIEISGPRGRNANQLRLEFVDGDIATWAFSLTSEGAVAQNKLDALLQLVETLTQPKASLEH